MKTELIPHQAMQVEVAKMENTSSCSTLCTLIFLGVLFPPLGLVLLGLACCGSLSRRSFAVRSHPEFRPKPPVINRRVRPQVPPARVRPGPRLIPGKG